MRVESYSIAAASVHYYFRRETVSESLRVNAGRNREVSGQGANASSRPSPAPSSMRGVPPSSVPVSPRRPGKVCPGQGKCEGEPRLAGLKALVEKMVEVLTGKKIRIRLVKWPPDTGVEGSGPGAEPGRVRPPAIEYRYTRELVEEESAVYMASGRVRTADGREIAFNLVLHMERERSLSESVVIRVGGEPEDPLVLVLDGSHARLSDLEIDFDLDRDGVPDRVPLPAPGSGFLVLDKNGDGRINDSGELFGPESGDGFAELSLHDYDGNGWIDEADPVFQDLRVWVFEGGEGRLYTLSELKVGALYLGRLDTPFTLSTAEGDRGRIGSTSFWLGEDGKVGVVQHLDFFI
ncbi:MAG: hypothetical protein WHT46_02970 [Candidatus Geothermincolales bacterium]